MALGDAGEVDELRARVRALALREGRNATPIAGVALIRADQPELKRGWSPSLSLGVLLQGRKRLQVGARNLVYQAGHYVVITGESETEAEILEASSARPYLSLSVQVDPALVARLLIALAQGPATDLNRTDDNPEPAYASPLEAWLVDVLVRLLRTADDPVEARILAPLILEELMFRLLRSESAAVLRRVACRGDDQRRIQAALAFIRDNAKRSLTVERIARHVAMSPSHFAHRFRAIARVSPMQYVKHVRLHEARLLMLHQGARPSQAASAVGYASTSHFTRDFKRHFDEPPAEHIQRLRAGARV